MFTRIRIRNFQSLDDVELELAPFTIVVGASNSGKSAVLRALRTLAFNATSPSFVTHGKKSAVLEAEFDGSKVMLERGPSLATYRVFAGDAEAVFAKAGTTVPDEIRELLKMAEVEGENLNFAFQFDRPFLLDETGTKAAKVLGDLTNINLVYEAVRETNRRRLESSARLKVRIGDEARLKERLEEHRDLPDVARAVEALREAHVEAVVQEHRVERLREVVDTVAAAETALAHLVPIESVDVEGVEETARKVSRMRVLLRDVEALAHERQKAVADAEEAEAQIAALDEEHHDRLVALGTCPVCGQRVGA